MDSKTLRLEALAALGRLYDQLAQQYGTEQVTIQPIEHNDAFFLGAEKQHVLRVIYYLTDLGMLESIQHGCVRLTERGRVYVEESRCSMFSRMTRAVAAKMDFEAILTGVILLVVGAVGGVALDRLVLL